MDFAAGFTILITLPIFLQTNGLYISSSIGTCGCLYLFTLPVLSHCKMSCPVPPQCASDLDVCALSPSPRVRNLWHRLFRILLIILWSFRKYKQTRHSCVLHHYCLLCVCFTCCWNEFSAQLWRCSGNVLGVFFSSSRVCDFWHTLWR